MPSQKDRRKKKDYTSKGEYFGNRQTVRGLDSLEIDGNVNLVSGAVDVRAHLMSMHIKIIWGN